MNIDHLEFNLIFSHELVDSVALLKMAMERFRVRSRLCVRQQSRSGPDECVAQMTSLVIDRMGSALEL